MNNYYAMCQELVKNGWTLNDIEDADWNTLTKVVFSKPRKAKQKEQRIDLVDYMKQKQRKR
ncbi:hypothetical protein [Enterococcus sp. CSURQ0835]|uniref:hypothetical protein n=1 Tax=Enterococcus sp. CSURQ0835 TaxID=2681394 RepID=UPI0013573A84|nr:hypothetical protein [Enterococcus sp. CSURQ0835]